MVLEDGTLKNTSFSADLEWPFLADSATERDCAHIFFDVIQNRMKHLSPMSEIPSRVFELSKRVDFKYDEERASSKPDEWVPASQIVSPTAYRIILHPNIYENGLFLWGVYIQGTLDVEDIPHTAEIHWKEDVSVGDIIMPEAPHDKFIEPDGRLYMDSTERSRLLQFAQIVVESTKFRNSQAPPPKTRAAGPQKGGLWGKFLKYIKKGK